jgi:hypothetical protein
LRVVRDLGEQERRGREGKAGREEQRVAVRGRLGDRVGTEHARCARPVVDEDGRLQQLAQVVAIEPCEHVGADADRRRRDDPDRCRRVGRLRPRGQSEQAAQAGAKKGQGDSAFEHLSRSGSGAIVACALSETILGEAYDMHKYKFRMRLHISFV